jgi:hypothetical protein
VVVWSADCDDWSQHPEGEIADKVLRAALPGAIVLMHDTLAPDSMGSSDLPTLDRAKIVELTLANLQSQGMKAVSLSELLRDGKAHRTLWFRS